MLNQLSSFQISLSVPELCSELLEFCEEDFRMRS